MNREGEGKIFARDSGFISGCPGRAPDLVFEIAGKAPDCHAMTLGSAHRRQLARPESSRVPLQSGVII